MRHAIRSQRLSRPGDHRQALVHGLAKSLIRHGQLETTYARAKEAQRVTNRLVTLGKDATLHARRQAYRILQDRTLVRQLFADIAPRFVDVHGGYTRVTRLSLRRGDGAQKALLAFSRLSVGQPAQPAISRLAPAPAAPTTPRSEQTSKGEASKKPAGFFEGLRTLWKRKKKGSAVS